jgi:hypothetical protein
MLRRRYEILLPLLFNDGSPIPDEAFYEAREELLARFDGLSWVPHAVKGIWKHEGAKYEDETVRIIVDVEDLPENRQFFVDWKPVLLERFAQIEMYIVSYPIERL